MIHSRSTPADLGMAVITLFTAFYMGLMFLGGGDLSSNAVTTLTSFGGALEDSKFVAVIAGES